MTTWTNEYWTVDGVDLHNYAWGVEMVGMDGLPTRRGSNFIVPYRHGEVWRPKQFGPKSYGLTMWVQDQSQNGAVGGITQTRANVERLKALFAPTDRELVITKRMITGADRYVLLGGVVGSFVSGQNTATNTVTGNLDVRVKAALDDWSSGNAQCFAANWEDGANNRGWIFRSTGGGQLAGYASTTGANTITLPTSSGTLPFDDGEAGVVRLVRMAATGGVEYSYSTDDGNTWLPLGSGSATSGDLHETTAWLQAGAYGSTGSQMPLAGKIYWVEVRDGVDGPVVARFDASDAGWGQNVNAVMSDATGEIWTLNGAADVVQPIRTLTGLAESVGTLDFTPDENFSELLRFGVELQMADPFWYGEEVAGSVPFAGGGIYNPGSATARKMLIQLNGPLTNPRLENQSTVRPVSVSYTGTIAGGTYVLLDTDLYTAYDNLGVNRISNIKHSGAHSWMELAPGGNILLFTVGTGSGSADFTFTPPYL